MSYGGDPVEGDEGLLHLVTSSTFLDLGDQTHSHSESDLNPVKLIPILFFFFFFYHSRVNWCCSDAI